MRSVQKFGHGRSRKENVSGFSLIELLIVVAIILIIAAIAIPNLVRAKAAANESVATASIHAINTAEIAYSSVNPTIGFAAALADLGPAGSGYLESNLAGGSKSGYSFALNSAGATPRTAYTITGNPNNTTSGTRYFFSDESGVIRYATGGAAVVTSPALQ